ncbi:MULTISPECIES: DEAD/DEAH box helicase [Haloferax]|uniref:ATP-dependent DNA helicase Hel308 n=1 Tax=Haloferax marinum TaxID=2666143 RepID=A0A6A8G6T1_9EURY|nr:MULTISPECIES: DEAD/DEAH box helicase [Haloferax]KAB1196815.1 DEAD/DEAH box helicase [Haloferax sp. CBA1150]MRW95826.1 DEAD/DEAH box helicase [Haloferax marinum]
MRVRDLPLPATLVSHYESSGIEELYPPQVAAVEAGIADGGRVVAAIPTASGKTFIAELAMLTADGPGLYIVPLRALAREKYETFDKLPGVSVGISTGDFDSAEEDLGEYDIVVATSEKVDSAIRNGASWVENLACVVVDEVHLLGAPGRGPTLEITLATLQRRVPDLQLVALSATVDNPEVIAHWLNAELVESTWRPVSLRTGVYADGTVEFDDDSTLTVDVPPVGPNEDAATEATVSLVADAVESGGQCLAFVRSRREAENLAERLADEALSPAPDLGGELAELGGTTTGQRLADCARTGVGFHHAGLRSSQRAAVENAFRDRRLAVICATPTLAAGVNVPARRVVIRDQKRYTGESMAWIPVLDVHQMCGRAGRPHLDPYGEAVLVGDDTVKDELVERYVEADAEAVDSQFADDEALRTHVLSVVASGFADSLDGVADVFSATYYAHQNPDVDLTDLVSDVVSDLVAMEMLTVGDDSLSATTLGAQTSRQYVSPTTGARIVSGVRTIETMAAENVTARTALEVVCDTPDMLDTYLGNRERAVMYQYARNHASEFTTAMHEADPFEEWLTAVKTARILHEWSEGVDIEELVDNYRIGPGDLESRVERAEWLLGAADALCGALDTDVPEFREVRALLSP